MGWVAGQETSGQPVPRLDGPNAWTVHGPVTGLAGRSRLLGAEELFAVVVAEQEGEADQVGAQLGEVVAVGAGEEAEGGGELSVIGPGEPLAYKPEARRRHLHAAATTAVRTAHAAIFDSFEFRLSCGSEEDVVTTTTEAGTVFPPENLGALLDLARFLEQHTEPTLLLGPDGEQAPLPEEIYRVLVKVVEALREGKAITVVPQTQRLTTQEAADFLGVSRPTLVKLLEEGKIPYDQPGRHRRILFSELLRYVEQRRQERRAALDKMTEDASEAGLYSGRREDYAAALKKARKRAAGPGAS